MGNDFKLKVGSKMNTMTNKWTFDPVDVNIWSLSEVRVMLLGAEPNGDSKYSGPKDMGKWFSAATPKNSYHKNRRFFTNNVAQLCGALAYPEFTIPGSLNADVIDNLYRLGMVPHWLKSLRYADLKATGGGSSAETDQVDQFVRHHFDEVLDLWSPTGKFQPPTHTVIQGGHAHQVFMQYIRPELARRGWAGLYLGAQHPSHQGSYESTRRGLAGMMNEFKSFSDTSANRWNGKQWVPIV